jgi:hypothetical protein
VTLRVDSSKLFFSKDDNIYGLSYREWTEKWWRWFYSAKEQKALDPIIDDNIMFLPSIIENEKEPLYLKTAIEKDKAILISVGKWISLGLSFMSDEKLFEMARDRINSLQKTYVMIDDVVVEPERVASNIFNLELKRDIINPKVSYTRINHIRKGKYKAIGDGYWIFIKPNELESGMHDIHTFAACESGTVTIDVHHNIEV